MKRILTVLLLTAVCTGAFAQKISYNDLKNVYDPAEYVRQDGDPYQVFWIGLESLSVPGIGQLVMRETKRGWMFLGGSIVLGACSSSLVDKIKSLCVVDSEGNYTIPDANKDKIAGPIWGLVAVSIAEVCLDVWSCVDAVKIAKVKNQYYQKNSGRQISANLYPSVNLVQNGNGAVPTAGMTFALNF